MRAPPNRQVSAIGAPQIDPAIPRNIGSRAQPSFIFPNGFNSRKCTRDCSYAIIHRMQHSKSDSAQSCLASYQDSAEAGMSNATKDAQHVQCVNISASSVRGTRKTSSSTLRAHPAIIGFASADRCSPSKTVSG